LINLFIMIEPFMISYKLVFEKSTINESLEKYLKIHGVDCYELFVYTDEQFVLFNNNENLKLIVKQDHLLESECVRLVDLAAEKIDVLEIVLNSKLQKIFDLIDKSIKEYLDIIFTTTDESHVALNARVKLRSKLRYNNSKMAKVTDEFIVHLKENVENLDIPNVTVENLNLVEDKNKTLEKKNIKQTNNQQTIPEPRNSSFSTRTGSTFTASSANLIESVENISDSNNTSNNEKFNTTDNSETNNDETI
jgi:hypothetical protein